MIQRSTSPIVIAAGLRTPHARAGGAFLREDAGNLSARLVRELLDRTGIDPAAIDHHQTEWYRGYFPV